MGHHSAYAGHTHELRSIATTAPMLTATEEVRLAREAHAGSAAARDVLVRSHLRLVLSIASNFRTLGVELDDLVSEGLLGMVEAVKRFDPDRGVRLAAYAAWWIRAFVRRYTIVNRRIVRPPSTRNARRVLSHLRTVQRNLTQKNGRSPDSQEVADALNVDASDVSEMEDVLRGRDVGFGTGPDETGREIASGSATPEDELIAKDDRRWAESVITEAMSDLSPRERDVFAERSMQETPPSLAAMGSRLGLSRERVRQIHERGYQKVRAAVLSSVA